MDDNADDDVQLVTPSTSNHDDSKENKEAGRLYAELCEPIFKFFILLIRNDPER